MESCRITSATRLSCLVLAPWPALLVSIVLAALSITAADANSQNPGALPRMVVFDIELQDASHEGAIDGERPDQTARLKLISDELRSLIRQAGRFEIVDIAPAQARIAKEGPLIYCNGCDGTIAHDLGAHLALTGLVYKVSNLILEIHLYVRDTNSGRIVAKMSSSIRGNTDESWLHGIRWMYRNRLAKAELSAP